METETRARIDEEVVLLSSNPHSRRIASPIYRLPPEILACIFIHCACDYHYDFRLTARDVPRWVNVSYVCRHWRSVALDCPTLWTYHFMVSLRWTEELLARSKQASLKIRALFGYTKTGYLLSSLVEKLKDYTDHIEELSLDFPGGDADRIFPLLSSPAPRLQILKLSVEDYCSRQSSNALLFDGDTPTLRTLELSYCSVQWYSFKLNSLTTLNLHHIPIQFRHNVEELVATLGSVQSLIYLYLDHALTGAVGFLSSAALPTSQRSYLAHLSRLLLIAPLSTVIALLSCVNIPPNAAIRIGCDPDFDIPLDDISLDDYVRLSSLLAERFSTPEDQPHSIPIIRSLVIVSQIRGQATIIFSSKERDSVNYTMDQHWGHNIPLRVLVDWSHAMVMLDEVMIDEDYMISSLCYSMPLTNVQSIHVTCPPFPSTFWRETLKHLPNLQYIKLVEGNMPDLASVLSLIAHEGEENHAGHDHMLAPALEELELYKIKFSEGSDSDLLAITQSSLFDALSTRNVSRGRLTMKRCKIGAFDVLDIDRSWDGLDIRVVGKSNLYFSDSPEDSD